MPRQSRRMKLRRFRFSILVFGFFALYALTAQRGTAWGDSAEFQDWVLNSSELVCGPHFSNAHPLYVVFCRAFAGTPFAVTLVSSFFGALSVGGLFLCTRRFPLAILFGLSQMVWWLSCVAEVQTMNLALTAFETWCLLEGEKARDPSKCAAWLGAAALMAGVHLGVHNFALLSLPVYVVALVSICRRMPSRRALVASVPTVCWFAGAAFWLFNFVTRGPADVLYGAYGAKVAGALPTVWTATAFNLVLASISFFAPAALVWWGRASVARAAGDFAGRVLIALFAVNFVFFARYFVPDQSQFLLPSLFYLYVLLRGTEVGRTRFAALAALQFVLPVAAFLVASELPLPEERLGRHHGRDDAKYFILPWRRP